MHFLKAQLAGAVDYTGGISGESKDRPPPLMSILIMTLNKLMI